MQSRVKLERAFDLLQNGSDELLEFALGELKNVNTPMVQVRSPLLI